jgi:hypothetical protein
MTPDGAFVVAMFALVVFLAVLSSERPRMP